jgi:hypothetical protein
MKGMARTAHERSELGQSGSLRPIYLAFEHSLKPLKAMHAERQ